MKKILLTLALLVWSLPASAQVVLNQASVPTCTNGQTLVYNSTTVVWECGAVGAGTITGSGTSTFLAKFTSGSAIGNSILSESGSTVSANTGTTAGIFSATSFVIRGTTSGSYTVSAPAVAGTGSWKFPAGSTDFTATGGTSYVLRQSSAGAAITVGQLTFADIASGAISATTAAFSASSGDNRVVIGNAGNGPALGFSTVSLGYSGADSGYWVGQDSTHGIQMSWVYNATAGNGYGRLSTYGGSYPIAIGSSTWNISAAGAASLGITSVNSAITTGVANIEGPLSSRPALLIQTTQSAGSGEFITFHNSSNGVAGNITHTASTTVAYNTTSDQRMKNDRGIATSIDVLRDTKIHDFDWKEDGLLDVGVFAQEAILVNPNAVTVGSDVLGDNGLPLRPWSVDYSKYVGRLIVGWQNLDSRLAVLEARAAIAPIAPNAVQRKAATDRAAAKIAQATASNVRRAKYEATQKCTADNEVIVAQGGTAIECDKPPVDAADDIQAAKKAKVAEHNECVRRNALIVKRGGTAVVCKAA